MCHHNWLWNLFLTRSPQGGDLFAPETDLEKQRLVQHSVQGSGVPLQDHTEASVVVHTCNHATQEAETEGTGRVTCIMRLKLGWVARESESKGQRREKEKKNRNLGLSQKRELENISPDVLRNTVGSCGTLLGGALLSPSGGTGNESSPKGGKHGQEGKCCCSVRLGGQNVSSPRPESLNSKASTSDSQRGFFP